MNRLKRLWRTLRDSFWFLPLVIVAGSVAVALALIQADTAESQQWMARWPRLFGASAAGARGVLSTIAGSMMTVVGVTFSMMLVTLTLASSQYTSRVLRNFTRDRVTQVVLGIFAGIFTYCLIVLRTVRDGEAARSIPSAAVTFGVVLAIGGIGALIFFIHHIAYSIQASSIIASVANETLEAIDRHFPLGSGQASMDGHELRSPPPSDRPWHAVPAPANGYIQSVDKAVFMRLALEHHTIVRMNRGIGEFVVQGTPLASLALTAPPAPELMAGVQSAYAIHPHRTVEQDAAFGIRQIVDVALRALSPGVNDTTTAVMCVDYLAAILARLAARPIPSSYCHGEGELRAITIEPTFADLVSESFSQIRASAGGNVAIMLRLLGAIEVVAGLTDSPGRRQTLGEQARWIAELAERTIGSPHDRIRVEDRLATVHTALEMPITGP